MGLLRKVFSLFARRKKVMQNPMVFVSYTHGAHDEMAQTCKKICDRLRVKIWLDKVSLDITTSDKRDQLDDKISSAIRKSNVLIIIISEATQLASRYGQRELRMALALRRENNGFPKILVIRSDDFPVPKSLSIEADVILPPFLTEANLESRIEEKILALSPNKSVDLSLSQGFVEDGLNPQKSRETEKAATEFLEWAKDNGQGIVDERNDDLSQKGLNAEEKDFITKIGGKAKFIAKLAHANDYSAIRYEYSEIGDSEFWLLNHEFWIGRPLYKFDAMTITADTMFACLDINSSELNSNFQKALLHLENLSNCLPFSMVGGRQEVMHVERARQANLLLIDALRYPRSWIKNYFGGHADVVAMMADMSPSKYSSIMSAAEENATRTADYLVGLE